MPFLPAGGVLDGVVSLPPSNGVDDTAVINDHLSAGGAFRGFVGSNYLISSPLILFSNTWLDMTGCTVTLTANENMVKNHALVAGAGRDSNIQVTGGVWDRGSNGGADSTLLMSLWFQRVDGLWITDLEYDSSAGKFGIWVYACTDFEVGRITFNCFSDGVHVQGASSQGWIHDLYGTTGDDPVALIPNDIAYTQNGDLGDITDVRIEGVFTTCATASRVKLVGSSDGAATKYNLRRISVRDVHLNVPSTCLSMGGDGSDPVLYGGDLTDIEIDGVSNASTNAAADLVECTLGAAANFDNLTFRNLDGTNCIHVATFDGIGVPTGSIRQVTIENTHAANGVSNGTSLFQFRSNVLVGHVTFRNVFFDVKAGNFAIIVSDNNVVVTSMKITECRLSVASVTGGLVQTGVGTNALTSYLVVQNTTIDRGFHAVADFGQSGTIWLSNLNLTGAAANYNDLVNVRAGVTLTIAGGTGLRGGGGRATRIVNAGTIQGLLLSQGVGAPTIAGQVGDLYDRQDGAAGTYRYRCTVAGDTGAATWTGIL